MRRMLMLILLMIILIINIPNNSFADDLLEMKLDKEDIKIDENFKIYVNIGDINVASYVLNMYFDSSKVEYISGTDNTNVVGNRIINIWYDEAGGKNIKINQQIAVFEFKAKEEGVSGFYLYGEFFDNNANEIQVNNAYIDLNISQKNDNTKMSEDVSKSNNTLLKIMRLDKEGIIPEFSPEIEEYYFITDLNTNSLDITAIPEAQSANVAITGNKDLKEGLNKIFIEVSSSDNTNKSVYTINVTKTNDIEAANTNLETLAIENVDLEPIFDTNTLIYNASVANNIDNLNVFAVPENINGKVEVSGNSNLKEGDNLVKVRVTAPNGYSYKDYVINAYRRTQEEDKTLEEEQKANSEKLNNIINEKGIEFLSNEDINKNNEENRETKLPIIKTFLVITGLIIIIGFIVFVVIKKRNKNK